MKGKSILEVLVVFVPLNLFKPFGYVMEENSGVLQWELKNLGWSYVGGVLLFAIPLTILLILKRRPKDFGFSFIHLSFNLDIGLVGYLCGVIPWAVGFPLLSALGSNYSQPIGALILALSYLISILLLGYFTRNKDPHTGYAEGYAKRQLITIGLILLFPILFALVMRKLNIIVVSTVIWQFLFSGFGEEFYWRGYFQSRINQEYGRPFSFLGIPFGVGLIVASLLFGISHGLNPSNILSGRLTFDFWWAFWTFFSGLFFGLIRKKTGSIIASGIVHGVVDAVGEAFGIIMGWI